MDSDFLTPGVGLATDALIWVEGPDAVSFLDGQLSQDVAGMEPGSVRRSFLLEPRGKLRALLWALRGTDRVGLMTAADRGDEVVADLERFRFRVQAMLRKDLRPVHSVWGSDGAGSGRWGDDGVTLVAAPSAGASRFVAATTPPAGAILDHGTLDAHRVAAGEPRFGVDVDEATIPQETGLVPEAVSFTKGCYLGQELVARIDSRGHVNRMLRRIRGSGEVPPPGATVSAAGPVGTLGTVAPRRDGWWALGLLRREAGPGTRVTVRWDGGEAEGAVAEIVRSDDPSHPSNTSSS
ncbi:MAG: folate-binding protein YgfZ [Acidimicrobiia bacterium]|nr:folate-binding protein YgfZ [Acidimicrobiia bacterium]